MSIPVANSWCESFLSAWIKSVASLPERHNIDAWLTAAENAACNATANEDIVLEMPALATVSGRPETVTLSKNCFDYYTTE